MGCNCMSNSILLTIKKMLGLDADYHAFDMDVIADINSALMIVSQLGVGPDPPLVITGDEETWSDLLGDNLNKYQLVKAYIHQKVKLMFDPPNSGVLHQAAERLISEFEWRLMVAADPPYDASTAHKELGVSEEGGE